MLEAGPVMYAADRSFVQAGRDALVARPRAVELLLRPDELGRDLLDRRLAPLHPRRRRVQLHPGWLRAGSGSRSACPRSPRAAPWPARRPPSRARRRPPSSRGTPRRAAPPPRRRASIGGSVERSRSSRARLRPEGRKADRPEQHCQVPGPLATILGTGQRALEPGDAPEGRVLDQLQGLPSGSWNVVNRRDPRNLGLVPVEHDASLLQSPSGLIEVLDPEDDRPARRHRRLLGPVEGEPDRSRLELRPLVAGPIRDTGRPRTVP